jgi:integrase
MRKTLTDRGVAALKPRAQRYAIPDPELRGLWIRVTPTGAKSFVAVTRDRDGKQVWTTIGATDVFAIDQAREQARAILQRVRSGQPAIAPKAETLGDVIASWLERHVKAKGLRSRDKIVGLLERHIDQAWRARPFTEIRRSDVVALLDEIEDDHGARQADHVFALLRSIMNWFASRHDDYVPPLVRGMGRVDANARARARILDDDEIRGLWAATETSSSVGALVRLLLLTGQRHAKVAAMKWSDVSDDGVWTIATAAREKGNAGALKLPAIALDIIRAQPRLVSNPHIFAGRGAGHISGTAKAKARLDELAGVRGWVLHDLRRTARSLMSRAGVRPDIAERVLGHAIGGVEGVYDRHHYAAEKAEALAKLAVLVHSIVAQPRQEASDKAA